MSPEGSVGFSSSLAGNGTITAGTPFFGQKSAVSNPFLLKKLEVNSRAVAFPTTNWNFQDMTAGVFKIYKDTADDFNTDADTNNHIKVDARKLSMLASMMIEGPYVSDGDCRRWDTYMRNHGDDGERMEKNLIATLDQKWNE